MNENTTIDMERGQESGQITYANEVIATIVSVATTEVEGISGIAGASPISGILAKGRNARGVKVDVEGEGVSVDVSVTVDYGMPIQKVGRSAQENVRKSIESMTGLHVEKVDLHVVGVSFEKENQEMQMSQQMAMGMNAEDEKVSETEESATEEKEETVQETAADEQRDETAADEEDTMQKNEIDREEEPLRD